MFLSSIRGVVKRKLERLFSGHLLLCFFLIVYLHPTNHPSAIVNETFLYHFKHDHMDPATHFPYHFLLPIVSIQFMGALDDLFCPDPNMLPISMFTPHFLQFRPFICQHLSFFPPITILLSIIHFFISFNMLSLQHRTIPGIPTAEPLFHSLSQQPQL